MEELIRSFIYRRAIKMMMKAGDSAPQAIAESIAQFEEDYPGLLTGSLRAEIMALSATIKEQAILNPYWMADEFGKRLHFLFLDARELSYTRLQDLLVDIRGDIMQFNVYGDFDVVLRIWDTPESVSAFVKELERNQWIRTILLGVKGIFQFHGHQEIQESYEPIPNDYYPAINTLSANIHDPSVDRAILSRLSDANIIVGRRVEEDTSVSHRIRALIGISALRRRQLLPGLLFREVSRLKDYQENGISFYQTSGDFEYLLTFIADDQMQLDRLTDALNEIDGALITATFVVARLAFERTPSAEQAQVEITDIQKHIKRIGSFITSDLFEANTKAASDVSTQSPGEALALTGLLARLRAIELDLLALAAFSKAEGYEIVKEQAESAVNLCRRAILHKDQNELEASIVSMARAVEGALKLALTRLVRRLFPGRNTRLVSSLLGLGRKEQWWKADSTVTLGELLTALRRWRERTALDALWHVPQQLLDALAEIHAYRNPASHFKSPSRLLQESFVDLATRYVSTHLSAVATMRYLLEQIIEQDAISQVSSQEYGAAVSASVDEKNFQLARALLSNTVLRIPQNEVRTKLRRIGVRGWTDKSKLENALKEVEPDSRSAELMKWIGEQMTQEPFQKNERVQENALAVLATVAERLGIEFATPSIFLSHASQDKDFVRDLAKDLRTHDVRVWYDEWDIEVGDRIMESIEQGLRKSDFLGIVLTPASVSSDWVRKELDVALMEQLSHREIRVLPILLLDCDIPYVLRDLKYADFRESYEGGMRNLLKALGLDGTT